MAGVDGCGLGGEVVGDFSVMKGGLGGGVCLAFVFVFVAHGVSLESFLRSLAAVFGSNLMSFLIRILQL